jgi:hypothetical protein
MDSNITHRIIVIVMVIQLEDLTLTLQVRDR